MAVDSIYFSIIVPHRNSINKLIKLLKSVPKRKDLEIIVVDDLSEDKIVLKLKQLSSKYGFSLIVNSLNRGAGYSRNIALKEAIGRWVIFADADDYFLNSFNELLDRYKYSRADLIFFLQLADMNFLTLKQQDILDISN